MSNSEVGIQKTEDRIQNPKPRTLTDEPQNLRALRDHRAMILSDFAATLGGFAFQGFCKYNGLNRVLDVFFCYGTKSQ